MRQTLLLASLLAFVHLSCSSGSSENADGGGAPVDAADEDGSFVPDAGGPDGLADRGPCTPSCKGLECGDDGCGGQCGVCDPDIACNNGKCGGDPPDVAGVWPKDFRAPDVTAQDVFETTATDTGIGEKSDAESGEGVWIWGDTVLTDTTGWTGDAYNNWDGWTGDAYYNWDAYDWGNYNWDGYNWEEWQWDGYAWDTTGWDAFNWDGAGWDFGPMPDGSWGDGGAGNCGDIDMAGTCEGNVLKYCAWDELIVDDCSEYGDGVTCGYDEDFGYYDCIWPDW